MGWSDVAVLNGVKDVLFQSLRGFGVGWSDKGDPGEAGPKGVSIPERVWGGLEPDIAPLGRIDRCVSIPERVWGGLEPREFRPSHPRRRVSIPERVWGGLEPPMPMPPTTHFLFQSLRGFGVGWSGLKQLPSTVETGFNP